uniref:AP2/ERF domain-containing protein n=1 Tax=Chloropicon primus TaxID=1764295 RepID=A0A7S2T7F8_9CHLO|mmetsp:Transcript_875/g.2596  ORF Transcript_875/g.2596 Transcript_875/m.2596 type:complete len:292 (+) Transcript_875:163-1038(+)
MDGIGLDWILLDPPYPVAFYPIEPSVMEVPSDPVGVPRGGTNAGTIATEPEGPLQRLNRLKKSTNSPEKVEEDARADHGARRPLQGQRRGRGARNEGTRRSTRRRKIAKSSDRGGQANEKGGTTRELRGISAHRNTGKWESHLWNPKVKRKGGRRKTGVQVYLGQFSTREEAARTYDRAKLSQFRNEVNALIQQAAEVNSSAQLDEWFSENMNYSYETYKDEFHNDILTWEHDVYIARLKHVMGNGKGFKGVKEVVVEGETKFAASITYHKWDAGTLKKKQDDQGARCLSY